MRIKRIILKVNNKLFVFLPWGNVLVAGVTVIKSWRGRIVGINPFVRVLDRYSHIIY